jgi:hypothetical protein
MRPLLVLLALVLLGGTARADMLPDPSSPDAHCTLAEQCPDGAECPSGIRQDAGVVQTCVDAQKAKGREYRCHRDGNYLGTAVYCSPGAHGSWTAPASPAASSGSPARTGCGRCAMSPGPADEGAAGMLGGILALLFAFRRSGSAS